MRRLAALVTFSLVAAACTSGGHVPALPPSSGSVKVVFLEDLSIDDATSMVVPAFQGAKLAFDAAVRAGLPADVELVAQRATPSELEDIARKLIADRSVVGVIAGPFLDVPAEVAGAFDAAGLPVLSLTTGGPGTGLASWFQMVPKADAEARVIAAYLRPVTGGTVCFAGDGSSDSSALVELAAAELGGRAAILIPRQGVGSSTFAAGVANGGCAALFWGGFGPEAAQIRLGLDAAGLAGVTLVGSDGMKDPAFLAATGAAGEGTVVACACVDITTSTDLAARRFIQDYQANFGLPPGPFAAEAWDVAHTLIDALGAGATTRAAVLEALRAVGSYQGLAGGYMLGPGGARRVNLFKDEGGRWIPLLPPP